MNATEFDHLMKGLKSKSGVQSTNGNFTHGYGVTEVQGVKKLSRLTVSHGGNMGSSLSDVDENLEGMYGIKNMLKTLRMFGVLEEDGSPDYSWYMVVKIPEELYEALRTGE